MILTWWNNFLLWLNLKSFPSQKSIIGSYCGPLQFIHIITVHLSKSFFIFHLLYTRDSFHCCKHWSVVLQSITRYTYISFKIIEIDIVWKQLHRIYLLLCLSIDGRTSGPCCSFSQVTDAAGSCAEAMSESLPEARTYIPREGWKDLVVECTWLFRRSSSGGKACY